MKEQNYKNHRRIVPLFHYGIYGGILVMLALAIVAMVRSCGGDMVLAIWATIATLVIALTALIARVFALKVQDRAIRAEEQLRHFILSGQRMDTRTRLSQMIALRFASDDEFIALAKRAVEEKMSSSDIKQAIKNWRTDRHRA